MLVKLSEGNLYNGKYHASSYWILAIFDSQMQITRSAVPFDGLLWSFAFSVSDPWKHCQLNAAHARQSAVQARYHKQIKWGTGVVVPRCKPLSYNQTFECNLKVTRFDLITFTQVLEFQFDLLQRRVCNFLIQFFLD